MHLDRREEKYSNRVCSESDILINLVKMLNIKEIDPEKVKELKLLVANIDNNDIKKALLIDKLIGENFTAKIVAIEVLAPGLIVDPEVRHMLLNHLKDHGQEAVRKALISVLIPSVNRYAEIEETIIGVLSTQFTPTAVKEHIIKVFASRLFRHETRMLVLSRLDDDSVPIRIAAAQALSHYTDNIEIYEKLLEKLDDKDDSVKIAVIKALSGKILRDDFKHVLISKLKSHEEHQSVKELIIEVLGAHLEEAEDIQEEFVDVFFNSLSLPVRNAVKEALVANLKLEKIQDMFVNALIYEHSKAKMKNNVKNKLNKLGNDEGDDAFGVVVNFKR